MPGAKYAFWGIGLVGIMPGGKYARWGICYSGICIFSAISNNITMDSSALGNTIIIVANIQQDHGKVAGSHEGIIGGS